LVGMCRASYAYQPKDKNDEALRLTLKELAEERHPFGCPILRVILKREGVVTNHKRTERIHQEEGASFEAKEAEEESSRITGHAAAGRTYQPAVVNGFCLGQHHSRAQIQATGYSR
jgi:hypothetical protein